MEFLNLIMNGFAYIFSTIEKKVEINLLMKSSSTVSGQWRLLESKGGGGKVRIKTLPLLKYTLSPLPKLIPELVWPCLIFIPLYHTAQFS